MLASGEIPGRFCFKDNMKKYLDKAAKAWANATLNIKRFADAYVEALDENEAEAQKAFSAAYPMFGAREWQRMYFVGKDMLLPQFVFKSDSFVAKLMKMSFSMEWQRSLVGASEDGKLRVDRGNGPERVALSDLTKKEEKALELLMSEGDSKLSPEELIEKFSTMVRTVNKVVAKRTRPWEIQDVNGERALRVNRACTIYAHEIKGIGDAIDAGRYSMVEPKDGDIRKAYRDLCVLATDMANELVKYSALRDDEWDFCDKHGYDSAMWNAEEEKEHEEIIEDIQTSRTKLQKYARKVLCNNKVTV
jgi:hypothetical protein